MGELVFDIWGHTDRGKMREENQDSIFFANSAETPISSAHIETHGFLMAVADGVGGMEGGGEASRLIINHLIRNYYIEERKPIPVHLLTAIKRANTAAHRDNRFPNASTTLTTAVLFGNQLHLAHVGDSRAYLIRNRNLHQLTEDHVFGNRLVRYLVSTDIVEAEQHEPIRLKANDHVLLCSDGLYRAVANPNEIAEIVSKFSAEEAVYQLIDLANARGGPDNISVIVAQARLAQQPPSPWRLRWESL